jgi:hypothetical protein
MALSGINTFFQPLIINVSKKMPSDVGLNLIGMDLEALCWDFGVRTKCIESDVNENPLFPCFNLIESIGMNMESERFSKMMFFTISLEGNSVSKERDRGVNESERRYKESFDTESTIVRVRSAETSFTGVQEENVPMIAIIETQKAIINRLL